VPGTAESWACHEERLVWAGEWLDVAVADVSTPSGRRVTHDVVRARRDRAACLVVNDSDQVMLTRRYRFITDRWGWGTAGRRRAP
jgi:hypothetical protein